MERVAGRILAGTNDNWYTAGTGVDREPEIRGGSPAVRATDRRFIVGVHNAMLLASQSFCLSQPLRKWLQAYRFASFLATFVAVRNSTRAALSATGSVRQPWGINVTGRSGNILLQLRTDEIPPQPNRSSLSTWSAKPSAIVQLSDRRGPRGGGSLLFCRGVAGKPRFAEDIQAQIQGDSARVVRSRRRRSNQGVAVGEDTHDIRPGGLRGHRRHVGRLMGAAPLSGGARRLARIAASSPAWASQVTKRTLTGPAGQ